MDHQKVSGMKSNNLLITNTTQSCIACMGDQSVISQFPHRNATKSKRNFVRTCPLTMKKIAEDCKAHQASVVKEIL